MPMRNVVLMKKVTELSTMRLYTDEQSIKAMVQVATICRAFSVKNNEHEFVVRDYEREQVMTDEDIRKIFNQYMKFLAWAIEKGNKIKIQESEWTLRYFIEAVAFFDRDLAKKFAKEAYAPKAV